MTGKRQDDKLLKRAENGDELETQIKKLKEQIEKMKCCGNCARACSSMFGGQRECWKCGVPTKWKLKS